MCERLHKYEFVDKFKDLRICERVCGALLGSKHNLFRNVVGTMRDPQEHRNQIKKEG